MSQICNTTESFLADEWDVEEMTVSRQQAGAELVDPVQE